MRGNEDVCVCSYLIGIKSRDSFDPKRVESPHTPKVGVYSSCGLISYKSLTTTNPTAAMAVQSICIPIGNGPSAPDDAFADEVDEVDEVVLLPPLLLDDVDELSAAPPTPVELRHLSFPRILALELKVMSAH